MTHTFDLRPQVTIGALMCCVWLAFRFLLNGKKSCTRQSNQSTHDQSGCGRTCLVGVPVTFMVPAQVPFWWQTWQTDKLIHHNVIQESWLMTLLRPITSCIWGPKCNFHVMVAGNGSFTGCQDGSATNNIKRMDLLCITATFSKCRAIRFEHKGGSCNMVCCWQGLVKQRRSADKSPVWIRFIAVNAIVATWCIDCETILLHDYWMVQTNMFFSGVLQYRCGGCRSGSADFDWCDVMVWFPLFKELWFSQVLRFWYVKYKCVLNLCKLSISAGCRAWVQLITRRNQTMSCQTYVYFKAGFISLVHVLLQLL